MINQDKKHTSKKEQVRDMFNGIAPRYDLLNHLLSFNIDKIWRKKTINCLKDLQPKKILDIACGTGDLTFTILKLKPDFINAIDLSENMISLAKAKQKLKKNRENISFEQGDSENLQFADNTFDAATVAFGVRNFENLEKGLSEILRVLKPNGKLVILEFSKPHNKIWNIVYNLYFNKILPVIGNIISGSSFAYTYLPNSVKEFESGTQFLNKLTECHFKNVKLKTLSGGIATIYQGSK